MSSSSRSIITTHDLDTQEIFTLFSRAKEFKKNWPTQKAKQIGLVFREPSTRTTTSFEVAAIRSGHKVCRVSMESSSAVKGESLLDELQTLQAMGFDLLIVRHGGRESLSDISKTLKVPLINAGEGISGHPTQALLDAYTLWEEFGELKGLNVLIVGDLAHSRVARSDIELFQKLGIKILIAGPDLWIPSDLKKFQTNSFKDAIKQVDAVMALRLQKERAGFDSAAELEFTQNFQLKSDKEMKHTSIILHPGPFNRGVEITDNLIDCSKSRIFKQVENGVFVRGALLEKILGGAS